jgi:hypothetical protein
MDRQHGTQINGLARLVRGLRFDRNPLRRATDRIETALLIGLIIAFAVGAPFAAIGVGGLVHRVAARNMAVEQSTHFPVTATVQVMGALSGLIGLAEPTARWAAPDGHPVTGQILVTADTDVGARVPIWVTRDGQLTTPPLAPSQVAGQAETAAALAALGCGVVLTGVGLIGRRLLDRRRMRAWDAEWLASGRPGMPRI